MDIERQVNEVVDKKSKEDIKDGFLASSEQVEVPFAFLYASMALYDRYVESNDVEDPTSEEAERADEVLFDILHNWMVVFEIVREELNEAKMQELLDKVQASFVALEDWLE